MKNIKLKIISSVMIITLITSLFVGCGSPEPSGISQSLAEIAENDKTTGATEVKETEKETESETESETEDETEPETTTRKQKGEEKTVPDETVKETQKTATETESSAPKQDGSGPQVTQPETKPSQNKPQVTQTQSETKPSQNKPQATQTQPETVIIVNDEPKIPEAYWNNYSYNCAVMYAYDTGDLSVLNRYDKTVYDVLTKKAAEIKNKYSSAYEREKACHDWVCDITTYDYDVREAIEDYAGSTSYKWGEWPTNEYADKRGLGQTSYECIINGKCVCAGYAVTMQTLLTMAGVECKYVSGIVSGESHAWNEARLDGEWYVVDATWDDGGLVNGVPTENTGHNRYKYFNIKGDDYFIGYFESAKTNSGKYSYYNQVITKLDNFRATAEEVTEYIKQCLENRSESIEVFYPADIKYGLPELKDMCPYYGHATGPYAGGFVTSMDRYLAISGIMYYDEPAVDLSQITVLETQDELTAALKEVYKSDSYKSGDVVLIWTKRFDGVMSYTSNKNWEIDHDTSDIINDTVARRLGIRCVKLIKK